MDDINIQDLDINISDPNGIKMDDMEVSLGDFDIDLNDSKPITKRYKKPVLLPAVFNQSVKYSKAQKMAEEFIFEENKVSHMLLTGGFIFGDLLEALCVKNNWLVKEMTISTLSLSGENVGSLQNLIKGGFIEKLDVIVSDYFYSHERNGIIKVMREFLDIDNKFQLGVSRTHTKIYQLHVVEPEERFITFYGSANMRSSKNVEQMCCDTNKNVYLFYKEFHNEIINKQFTIKKEVKNGL